MKVSRQAEEYEDEALDDEELDDTEEDEADGEDDGEDEYDEDDEDDEEDDSSSSSTLFGIEKKYLIIGVAVAVLGIIGITMFTRKPASETVEDYEQDYVADYVEPTPAPEPTSEPEQVQGTVNDIYISDEEASKLQLYGYTADEIELAKQFGITADSLIESLKKRQTNSAKEVIKQLSDTGSIAYQNLANLTYLGQEYASAPVDQTKVDPTKAKEGSKEETITSSYEKCPTYGVQLQLKCKVLDNVYIWYTVTPQRWVQLPDTGSITLHVIYAFYGDNVYVTKVEEVTDPNARVVQSDAQQGPSPFVEEQEGSIVE